MDTSPFLTDEHSHAESEKAKYPGDRHISQPPIWGTWPVVSLWEVGVSLAVFMAMLAGSTFGLVAWLRSLIR